MLLRCWIPAARPLSTWTREKAPYLSWKDEKGGIHRVYEDGPHPYVMYQKMKAVSGSVPFFVTGKLLRHCHRRLSVPLVGRPANDMTGEVIPTRKLFEEVLQDEPGDHTKQSYFRYLCKARLIASALQLKEESKLEMDLGCYALLVCAAVTERSPDVLSFYEKTRHLYYTERVQATHHPANNASKLTYAMLYYASLQQHENAALGFFRAYRKAKMIEAAALGSNPPSQQTIFEVLELPKYEEPKHDVKGFLRKDAYGPTRPKIDSLPFALLLKSCKDMPAAVAVYNEAATQEIADAALLKELIEKCIYHNDLDTANSYMGSTSTLLGNTSQCWAAYAHLVHLIGAGTEERYSAVLKRLSGERTKLTRLDAERLLDAISRTCQKHPEMAAWLEGYIGEAIVRSSSSLRRYIDTIRGNTSSAGMNLGEEAAEPSKLHSDLKWEKQRTLAKLVDVAGEHVTIGDDEWTETVPWVAALKDVATNFEKKTVIFSYTYGGAVKDYSTAVVGNHPFEQLKDHIKHLGGTASIEAKIWKSAGDAGVATLIQVARVRLVYSMSITMFGGFEDVLLQEVSQTQALFKEAGAHGLSGKWTWRALRFYEDEADDIISEYKVETRALSAYRRYTIPSTAVTRQERRDR